jgi:hypothetical protein
MVRSLGEDLRQRAAVQQIAEWLEKLGMSEYAQRFAENDVDISVLPHISDHDLKELGVSLGHRRKMLAAIAKLDAEALAAAAPVLWLAHLRATLEEELLSRIEGYEPR